MKKADLIIIAAAAILAAVFFIFYNCFYKNSLNMENDLYVNIVVNNETLARLSLNTNQEYALNNSYGYNLISISDNKCFVIESDCSNKLCINEGSIEKQGETICCLPHKLLIYIE